MGEIEKIIRIYSFDSFLDEFPLVLTFCFHFSRTSFGFTPVNAISISQLPVSVVAYVLQRKLGFSI